MARRCSSPGCAFTLPDKYPLSKCPWHLAPGKGPVKIAAAITIAAAGFGGGMAYKKFRAYLHEKNKRRDATRKKAASKPAVSGDKATASRKRSRTRKRAATRKTKPIKAETT